MGKYDGRSSNSNQSRNDDNVKDDVDMTEPTPVQDVPEQPKAAAEGDSAKEENSESPVTQPSKGSVVGRRNENLPTENLSAPATN